MACTKTHVPWNHGPKTFPIAAFIQPVSDMFHTMSEGVKFIQYLLKTKRTSITMPASGNQKCERFCVFLFFWPCLFKGMVNLIQNSRAQINAFYLSFILMVNIKKNKWYPNSFFKICYFAWITWQAVSKMVLYTMSHKTLAS